MQFGVEHILNMGELPQTASRRFKAYSRLTVAAPPCVGSGGLLITPHG